MKCYSVADSPMFTVRECHFNPFISFIILLGMWDLMYIHAFLKTVTSEVNICHRLHNSHKICLSIKKIAGLIVY